MSVRNGIVLLVALSTLLFLAACGGNGTSIATPVAPPSGAFSNSNLNGTYVFSISGTDVNGAPYAMAGTFTANGSGGNGKGGITGGTLDINDSSVFSAPAAGVSINNNSSYSVTADGRGQAVIGTNITSGTPGQTFPNLTFDFVLTDSTHGLITEFDSFGSGSGTLDLQAANTTPTGTYAFSLSGVTSTDSSWATVGNFTVTGSTIAGLDDLNEGGILPYANSTLSGSLVLGPSATPATTLSINNNGSSVFSGTFDTIAIDATHLKFIEMDATATLSGDAFSQTSATLPTGTLAFTLDGISSGQLYAAGGFMSTAATGAITGSEDYNVGGTNLSSQTAPAAFSAAFTAAGAGRFTLGSFTTFVGGTSYAAYPSSGGLLLLETDATGITFGAAYTQTPGAVLAASQGYGMNLSGVNLSGIGNGPVEVDDIAEFTTATGGTLTGIIDENYDPTEGTSGATLGIPLTSGSYGAIDSNGRYGLAATAVTSNGNAGTLLGGFTLTTYAVDGTTFPFIELDGGQVSTGVIVLQNPSASSAAIAHSHMFVVRPLIMSHKASKKKTK
ncbi:MAG: hypothetical protein WBV55_15880 [Candidatus Sulfotelmatobacter sp.]